MFAPSFEVEGLAAARKEQIKQKGTNGTKVFRFRVGRESSDESSFPLLSSVKDLQTNQTEGNEGNEVF
jgi:hypothetical protein